MIDTKLNLIRLDDPAQSLNGNGFSPNLMLHEQCKFCVLFPGLDDYPLSI